MGTTNTELASPCPTLEDISAWHDQELIDESIELHIAKCDQCREVIDDFKHFNDTISDHIIVDDETLGRIKQNCIKSISVKHPKSAILSFPVWLKIAACFLIIGVIFGLRQRYDASFQLAETDQVISTPKVNKPVATPKQAPGSGVFVEAQKSGNITQNPASWDNRKSVLAKSVDNEMGRSPALPASQDLERDNHSDQTQAAANVVSGVSQGSLDLSDIRLVGFGVSDYDQTKQSARKSGVSNYVHHVWIVDDPTSPLEALKNLIPSHAEVLSNLINQNQDRYHLQFRIFDNNLQSLVNHFGRIGCKLVSPASPQPNENGLLEFSRKVVQYEVDFVKK